MSLNEPKLAFQLPDWPAMEWHPHDGEIGLSCTVMTSFNQVLATLLSKRKKQQNRTRPNMESGVREFVNKSAAGAASTESVKSQGRDEVGVTFPFCWPQQWQHMT